MDFRSLSLFSLAFAFLFAGCETQHVAYHSTASVPYYTQSTSTQMQLIGEASESSPSPGPNETSGRGYVIFSATDNQQTSYVLLAPEGTPSGYSFEAANFGRAVPLQKKQASALIDGLNRTLEIWGKSNEEGEGDFYEFLHAPEQDVDPVSPNVVEWVASVKFTASNTPDGPTARLVLGDSPKEALQYVVEFDERKEVATFRDLLQKARDQMGSAASR
jgi:hypothetical protein